MKLHSLQSIRDTIRGNIMAENVAKQANGDDKKLHNALAMVPESEMWRLVTWLHEILLPKVALHRGADSDEYKNYVAIRDAVIWAMYISQQYEKVLVQRGQDRQLLGYYVKQNAYFESELLKYTTAENIFSADAAAVFADTLVSKAIDILNLKK